MTDIARDHVEWRDTGADRSYAYATIVFPHSTARVPQDEVELAAAIAKGAVRAWDKTQRDSDRWREEVDAEAERLEAVEAHE